MVDRISPIRYMKVFLTLVPVIAISLIHLPSLNTGLANNEIQIFPYGSEPYNLRYGEWTEKWWQWVLSIPQDRNPLLDPTGKFCGDGQSDQNVFFLAGTLGGKAERVCTVSSDKALFFPILNIRPELIRTTDFELIEEKNKFISENQDAITLVSAQIDNKSLINLPTLRTQSQFFNLTYPEVNTAGVGSERTIAISNGTWIMLEPLAPGYHRLNFQGILTEPIITDQENLVVDMTYHIDVLTS